MRTNPEDQKKAPKLADFYSPPRVIVCQACGAPFVQAVQDADDDRRLKDAMANHRCYASIYGDACAKARTEARSELARLLPGRTVTVEHVELLTELFVKTIHAMPPWALRAIADRK